MPLAAIHDGRDVSGTARNAFGAVAMAPAADPVTLARLLVHEFQQVKMGAILDLYDLHDRGDDRLFPVPWGEGKLHLEGLLRGAYAHLAVSEFWRVRRQSIRLSRGRLANGSGNATQTPPRLSRLSWIRAR